MASEAPQTDPGTLAPAIKWISGSAVAIAVIGFAAAGIKLTSGGSADGSGSSNAAVASAASPETDRLEAEAKPTGENPGKKTREPEPPQGQATPTRPKPAADVQSPQSELPSAKADTPVKKTTAPAADTTPGEPAHKQQSANAKPDAPQEQNNLRPLDGRKFNREIKRINTLVRQDKLDEAVDALSALQAEVEEQGDPEMKSVWKRRVAKANQNIVQVRDLERRITVVRSRLNQGQFQEAATALNQIEEDKQYEAYPEVRNRVNQLKGLLGEKAKERFQTELVRAKEFEQTGQLKSAKKIYVSLVYSTFYPPGTIPEDFLKKYRGQFDKERVKAKQMLDQAKLMIKQKRGTLAARFLADLKKRYPHLPEAEEATTLQRQLQGR